MSINGQDLLYAKTTPTRPAVQLSKACAYEVVAQGFNCAGVKVTKYEEVGPAIKKLSTAGPALLNMIVSVKPTSPATLSMVGATDDPNVSIIRSVETVFRALMSFAIGHRRAILRQRPTTIL